MPLPASVPVGTVTGRYYEPDGDNATGTAYFLLLNEIEVPDDADGVVIPLMTKAAITGGVLNITLPAGYYNTRVRLGDWYEKTVVIKVENGVALNLPDAIDVVPPEELLTPVRSVNGVLPDASGNIEISGGGGGSVSSVFGRTGAVTAQSGDYTKAQVGLGNVDNTSDLAKPVSTATQTALDTKEASGTAASTMAAHVAASDPHTQYALESSLATVATSGSYNDLTNKPTIPTPVKGFATTGKIQSTFGPGDTSGTWTVVPSQWRVTIPAAVGDVLGLDPSIIALVGADAEMDVCSYNPTSNTRLRYYSSGTTTQAPNGHGGLYMGQQYNHKVNPIKWVVTADDIVDGNVTLAYMYRSGSGITWGSGVYPNEITLINEGAP